MTEKFNGDIDEPMYSRLKTARPGEVLWVAPEDLDRTLSMAEYARLQGALSRQTGGDHYKKLKIQPVEYIHANALGFCEGSVVKYVSRWRDKGGLEDLKKARHFLDLLIELEGSEE